MMKSKKYILILIMALVAVILPVLGRVLSYLSGYFSTSSTFAVGLFMLDILIWPGQILLTLILIIFFLYECFNKNFNYKKLFLCILLILGTLSVSILSFPLQNTPPTGTDLFMKGFESWVIKQVDTSSIQTWIQSADAIYWEAENNFFSIAESDERGIPEELPDFIKEFGVQYISFERSELDNSRIIRFGWGGGMFRWSLVIGGPNMEMPKQEVEWYSDYDVEFRRIIKPVVYVFTRG